MTPPGERSPSRTLPGQPRRPLETVGVVATGGTLGSSSTDGNDVVLSTDRDDPPEFRLIKEIADRRSLHVIGRSPIRVSSEDIRPDHWVHIAEVCRSLAADGVDAVLVLHGTDTAAYLSAALSFFLADLPCPVAITGANVPPGTNGSDAATNINGALAALGALDHSTVLAFAGAPESPLLVHSGTHARKTGRAGATFESIGRPILATADRTGAVVPQYPVEAPLSTRSVAQRIRGAVALLRCHPGADMMALADTMLGAGTRGVVLELFESFTAPTLNGEDAGSVTEFARRCVEAEIAVFGVTGSGTAGDVRYYESTRRLEDSGAVLLPGILPETTTVKLMIGLAQPEVDDRALIEAWMVTPVADEFVEPITDGSR